MRSPQLVLRNNYLQSQAISLMELRAVADLGEHQRLLRWLERHGDLDRAVEFLPSDEALEERRRQGTRPHASRARAAAGLRQDRAQPCADRSRRRPRSLSRARTAALLSGGAASPLSPSASSTIACARQIIITATTNSLVNRVGPALLMQCVEQTGSRCRRAGACLYHRARQRRAARALERNRGARRTGSHQRPIPGAADDRRLPAPSDALAAARRRKQYADVGLAVAQLQPALRELAHLIPAVLEGSTASAISSGVSASSSRVFRSDWQTILRRSRHCRSRRI